jgi:hypothetical protein
VLLLVLPFFKIVGMLTGISNIVANTEHQEILGAAEALVSSVDPNSFGKSFPLGKTDANARS